MKPALRVLAIAAAVTLAQTARANDPINPPNATFAGTTEIAWNGPTAYPKRVGIVAYCADLYHNAGDTGLQANKRSVAWSGQKQALANVANGLPPFNDGTFQDAELGVWFLDGPFSRLGNYGAQNFADMFAYDDGIDRVRDLAVIDGDMVNPTSTQLIQNFDIVIAYTDNKCGPTLPTNIANSAGSALAAFAASPGKKLILTGFAFSTSLGFGNNLYSAGLSPLRKGGPGNAQCSRDVFDGEGNPAPGPCHVGVCPAGCSPVGNPPECFDGAGNYCSPHYEPSTATTLGTNNADFACSELLNNVRGPTTSSWATNLTTASVQNGASLCFQYNATDPNSGAALNGGGVPFIAINAARTVYAVNAFPPDAKDIQKFWFSCMIANIVQYLSGDKARCPSYPFCN